MNNWADFNSMYLKIFNAVTDAIKILQQAQAETEEMYIKHEPDIIKLLRPDDGGDETV